MRTLLRISGLAFLALSGAPRVRAQAVLDPANPEAARAVEAFENVWKKKDEARIRGSWTFTKPALGYNLRYWVAYDLLAPASQFDLARTVSVGVILCIEPAGGKPVYLFQRHDMKPPRLEESAMKAAAKRLSLHFGGGFFAGAGKYTYRFLLADQDGRVFRKSGSFDVKQSPAGNAGAPGSIAPLGAPAWSGFPAGAAGGHATVLIHAAPVSPRRNVTRLQPYDRYVLISALGALLSQGGYSSAHVIVFDLAGRRVLFDEENFDRPAMRRLRRTLDEADFATIAYQTLATGPSPQQVAESVLLRAAEQRDDRETVVFLGPAWMPARRQRPIRPALKEALPKVHYLALVPRPLLPQDAISEIVRALKGRVHPIYQPSDFIAAIRKLAAGG
jgi:hypothetical protein